MNRAITCLILAGFGGIMPVLAKLATGYLIDLSQPPPNPSILFGLLVLFILGGVTGFVLSGAADLSQHCPACNLERNAFLLGIAAPALVTSVLGGVHETLTTSQTSRISGASLFIRTAHAQAIEGAPKEPNRSLFALKHALEGGLDEQ